MVLNEKYGKPMWTSEGWDLNCVNDYNGGLNLASTINRNYVRVPVSNLSSVSILYSIVSILHSLINNGYSLVSTF